MKSFGRDLIDSRETGLAFFVVATFMAASVMFPSFASVSGMLDTLDDTSILMLLAVGQTLVLLTRAIDLSVAANLALTGMIAALVNQAFPDVPVIVLLLMSTAIGACLGALNGAVIWSLGVPSIVVTLGTMAIYRGLVFVVSGGAWVTSNEMTPDFQEIVRVQLLGLSLMSWLAIAAIVLGAIFLRHTVLGRRLYLVGGNPAAASSLGVSTGATQFFAFTVSGAVAGLCGYLWVARFAVAYTDVASGFELQVIAACVIGGVSVAGGVGRIAGVALGCLFLGIIKNALPLLGLSPYWQMAVSGLIITGAVILNARRDRASHGSTLVTRQA
ncbi:MAG: ABC transporter permease [Phycisphaerae bacterium]|nr:ABC transporter permease [Phycisphaerae bacterium]